MRAIIVETTAVESVVTGKTTEVTGNIDEVVTALQYLGHAEWDEQQDISGDVEIVLPDNINSTDFFDALKQDFRARSSGHTRG